MTPTDLIAAFEALAEAPEGVVRLRELVLQLAVRGRLVPQDPKDEPASMLLDRIAAERARLVKAGEASKPKSLLTVSDADYPLTLPAGWMASRFEAVHRKLGAGSTPLGGKRAYVKDGIAFIRSQNVWDDGLRLGDVARITPSTHASMKETVVQPNDVLLNITGASIGRSAMAPADIGPANVSQHVAIVRQIEPRMSAWVHLFLISPDGYRSIMGAQVGISREGLSMASLREFVLPVPPLAEQVRIVARVEELIDLLDRLEAARAKRETTRAAARDSVLAALRDANSPAEVDAAWTRFAQRMDDLVCDPADIAPLRQTVLHLAVRGRLVPQESRDGATHGLLQRIAQDGHVPKVKSGQWRSEVDQQSVSDGDAPPFALPPGWVWARLESLTSIVTSGSRSWKELYAEQGASFIRSQDIKYDSLAYDERAFVVVPKGAEGARTMVRQGDLLMTITGANVGKCALIEADPGEAYVSQHVALIRLLDPDMGRFCHIWLIAEFGGRGILVGNSYGAKPGLNLTQLRQLQVPVPPAAEQRRIVARVEELMRLLERLGGRLTAGKTVHESLASAAVHHLEPDEFPMESPAQGACRWHSG